MENTLICKTCGAPLYIHKAVDGVVECEYCGNLWTVPRHETDPAALHYLRMGEHDLDTCKFDDAFVAYSKAAELDEEEPEAYFGMALATFKVQHLKDEASTPPRLQPICHEISNKAFSLDKNYIRAFELATDEQKKVYKARGAEIDEIREQFLVLKGKGINYDCFICVKVSDEKGGTTQDNAEAMKLYHHLKESGYSPFFSEFEIGKRTGSDYEAMILYALYTSECMLIVCSNEEYLQTKWVKNEYTRFMKMIANDEKEKDAITFVFKGKPIEKLPGKNGKIQGIDLTKPDAYSKITSFVHNHTPEARKAKEAAIKAQRQAEEDEKRRNAELAEQFKKLQQEQAERQKEEAARKAREEEEQRKRNDELAEQLRKMQEALAEQQKRFEQSAPAPSSAGGVSGSDLLAMMRKAQEDEERIKRENEAKPEWEIIKNSVIKDNVLVEYLGEGGCDLIIPEGITKIGQNAFNKRLCKNFTKVVIPSSVVEIGQNAFASCTKLINIEISSGVKTIEIGAFSGCTGLRAISIPGSVTSIGSRAFENCRGLVEITVPSSVTSIGVSVFKGCSGLMFATLKNSPKSIGAYMFYGCECITGITIPSSVSLIDDDAFGGCKGLTNVVIPEGLKTIGAGAFGNCTKLSKITIPYGVTSIRKSAFIGCIRLSEAVIPDSVTDIGEGAFQKCTWLSKITIPNGLKSINAYTFNGCTEIKNITIPSSVTSIGEKAFNGCTGLTSVVIPSSVTSTGKSAFNDCTGLTSVTITNGVGAIDDYSFRNCTNLKNVTIPSSVTSIGQNAFSGSGLTSITIPANVTSIRGSAFGSCKQLASATIQSSITSIDFWAFSGCDKLTQVSMPKKFEELNDIELEKIFNKRYKEIQLTFAETEAERSQRIKEARQKAEAEKKAKEEAKKTKTANMSEEQLQKEAEKKEKQAAARKEKAYWAQFDNSQDTGVINKYTGKGGNVVLPENTTTLGDAFYQCSTITSVTIPKSVKKIFTKCFVECENLKEIIVDKDNPVYHSAGNCLIETKTKTLIAGCQTSIIPSDGSVTTIGKYAFRGCLGIKSIDIPEKITKIEEFAFYSCGFLGELRISSSVKEIGDGAFFQCSGAVVAMPKKLAGFMGSGLKRIFGPDYKKKWRIINYI